MDKDNFVPKGFDVSEVEFRWISRNTIEVRDPEQARSLIKLMNALDDLDDVQNVTANFDIANQLLNTLAS